MTTHALKLEKKYEDAIKDGSKTIEARLNDEKRKKIKVGEFMLFNDVLMKQVKKISHYSSFEEMFEHEPLRKILPGVRTVKDGLKIYLYIYSGNPELANGVLAFHLE